MDNLRGAALMTVAMFGFAVEDMFIKMMSGILPTWQIILCLALGGATVFGAAALLRGERLIPREAFGTAILVRNLGELIGTLGFVTAIALVPLSTASAILQATPLAVTLGAALFLGEPVGWRRWSAILVGFLGVLMVIRPGTEAFDPLALFAVLGVIGLGVRDLATRRVPTRVSSFQLSFLAFLTLIPAAAILALAGGQSAAPMPPSLWILLVGAIGMAVVSYYLIVAAMRIGEVSFVTPFRYSRILFALGFGTLVFGERPDALMLAGSAVIVGSGAYTLWREQVARRKAGFGGPAAKASVRLGQAPQ